MLPDIMYSDEDTEFLNCLHYYSSRFCFYYLDNSTLNFELI